MLLKFFSDVAFCIISQQYPPQTGTNFLTTMIAFIFLCIESAVSTYFCQNARKQSLCNFRQEFKLRPKS